MKKAVKLRPEFRERILFVRLFDGDVYAVGGYVRDLAMGTPSEDVDILVIRNSLEDIIRRIKPHGKVDLVGKSFGIIKFAINRRTYDIALPRKDVPAESKSSARGHKDFLISADPNLPLERDLERRDFRCNSMALRLKDGALIDPFGGLADIRARRIRLTNPRAFPDDPLRVLRAARFASVLQFSVHPEVYEIAREIDLRGLSVERINEEIFKLLLLPRRPSAGLEELFRVGALRQLFPELYRLTLSIQDSLFHPEKDAFGHHTVWHHTKLTVDQAMALAESAGLSQERKLCLLLAALYHDAGKPATAQWEFKKGRMVITNNGHDLVSEKIARKVLARFRIFSWNGYNLRKMVPLLIRAHHRLSELWQNRASVTRKAFNRLAAETGGEIDLLVYLDAADRAGRKERLIRKLDLQGRWFLHTFDELKVSRESIKPLVMGRDLIKMGVAPGPEMGKILKKLYVLQLDSVFETKTGGLEAARQILKRKRK
ncbi:MAG: CCA tRNA nucleotidyltransferase [Candidatus Aminicenantes bacterium]|nr:CCA tRNA nucleotidyltransferase [Candidatus Aminicenantes bacterium]